jgi:hypothetical protein
MRYDLLAAWAALGVVAAFGFYGMKQIGDRRREELERQAREDARFDAIAEYYELARKPALSSPEYDRLIDLGRWMDSDGGDPPPMVGARVLV